VDVFSVVLVLGATGLFVVNYLRTGHEGNLGPHNVDAGAVPSAEEDEGDQAFWTLARSGQRIGPANSPVAIVLFSDYACGHAAKLNKGLKKLLARYPQHLSMVVKHFAEVSLRPRFNVTLGALCAEEQGYFREYHFAASEKGQVIDYSNGWHDLAVAVGLPNLPEFDSCVRSRQLLARVERDRRDARELGVEVTPTLFVNGDPIIGAVEIEVLDSIISSHLPDRRGGPTH